MKLIGIPYDKKEKGYKHFTTLKIQNRLYLKMAKTELACLCMEPFNCVNLKRDKPKISKGYWMADSKTRSIEESDQNLALMVFLIMVVHIKCSK